jgi:hypothetical protein
MTCATNCLLDEAVNMSEVEALDFLEIFGSLN